MTTAIYAGSFNQFYNGHLSVLTKAAELFDNVYLIVATNNSKTGNKKEDELQKELEDRAKTIADSFEGQFTNVATLALRPGNLLLDVIQELNANVLVRGVRGSSDLDIELQMADFHKEYVNTVFLTADPQVRHLSSSMVREVLACQGWYKHLSELVPPGIYNVYIEQNKAAFLTDVWYDCCKFLYGYKYDRKVANDWIRKIGDVYGWRAYHNLDHLFNLVKFFAIDGSNLELAICMAAFFHDFVNWPASTSNEEDSVAQFQKFNEEMGYTDFEQEIIKQILNTKLVPPSNQPYWVNKGMPELEDHYQLRNQDFAILAADEKEYGYYRIALRREYASFSDETYTQGRIKVLEKLLQMPIFYGFGAYDMREKAYANINRELAELKKGG